MRSFAGPHKSQFVTAMSAVPEVPFVDFDPTSVGLPADFVLTKFSKLKG